MARYRLVPTDGPGEAFKLWRDKELIVSLVGPRQWAEEQAAGYERQERDARAALRSSDPLAVCRVGWHRTDGIYFRLGTRLRDGTYVYRVCRQPFEFAATTIWCYGDRGKAWVCSTCGRAIEKHASRNE